jgi:hypothetical protein
MRAKLLLDIAALALLASFAAPLPAAAVNVKMDESALVNLSAPAGDIVVGNVSIADVSLINPRRIAILGRSYGLTNVIVTDRMGRTIFQQEVNVEPAAAGRVSLYRGPLISNFACSPRCARTPLPGEDKDKNWEVYDPGYKDYLEREKNAAQASGGGSGQ